MPEHEHDAPTLPHSALPELVFDDHPHGLLVTDASGTVVGYNRAATELVGSALLVRGTPRAACAVLGCRKPDGPLSLICLHEQAAAQEAPLPEVRVDLAGGGTAWVIAARMRSAPHLILNELRPGVPGDRRRRTVPHWTSGAHLRVITLGRTRVVGNEGPLDGRWLSNRSGKIFKFLIAHRHRPIHSDELAEKLWQADTPANIKALRYFVHVLRTELEPGRTGRGKSAFVIAEPRGYALDRANIEIDADAFEQHVLAGLAAARAGDDRTARDRLTAGVALYGGDFLADEPYAEWALLERDRLHNLAGEALRTLVRLAGDAGDLDDATSHLERLTVLEPFDSEAHAELLGLLVRRGRRSEAVRRYNALRHRLLATFGDDVDFTLADVVEPRDG